MLKTIQKADIFLALASVAMLFGAAASQNTADGWYKKGVALKALSRNIEADVAFASAKKDGYIMPN